MQRGWKNRCEALPQPFAFGAAKPQKRFQKRQMRQLWALLLIQSWYKPPSRRLQGSVMLGGLWGETEISDIIKPRQF